MIHSTWLGLVVPFGGVGLLLVLLHIYLTTTDYYRKGSKLPGNRPIPLFGTLLDAAKDGFDASKFMNRMCEEGGGIAAIWQGYNLIVVISRAEFVKTFYTLNHRPDQYQGVIEFLGHDALFSSQGEAWKHSRKVFMSTYSTVPIQRSVDSILEAKDIFLGQLQPRADGITPFPASDIIRMATADSILRSAMDVQCSVEEIQDMVLAGMEFVSHIAVNRQLSVIQRYDTLFYLTKEGRSYAKVRDSVRRWCSELIAKKRQHYQKLKSNGEPTPNVWIYNMFENYPSRQGEGLIDDFITIMITGTATTASAIGFTLLTLALHPEMQERIYEEVKQGQDSLRGRHLQREDLEQYQFMDIFIKESMRILPTSSMEGRKTHQDTQFGEYLVPKGANIFLISELTYHDENNFPEPARFDPARFLPENRPKANCYTPFGTGPRICPGMQHAMTAIKILISSTVFAFRIRTTYKSMKEVRDNKLFQAILSDSQQYPLILEPRSKLR